jgi:hypothetical protein
MEAARSCALSILHHMHGADATVDLSIAVPSLKAKGGHTTTLMVFPLQYAHQLQLLLVPYSWDPHSRSHLHLVNSLMVGSEVLLWLDPRILLEHCLDSEVETKPLAHPISMYLWPLSKQRVFLIMLYMMRE